MTKRYKEVWKEFPIMNVIDYFIEGFSFKEDVEIWEKEYFFDPVKKMLVLKIGYYEKEDTEPKGIGSLF